jgi:O-antigen ligase
MRSPGDVRLQLLSTKRLKPHLFALVPGLVMVGLMLVWAVDDGGYDPGTWYWGALVALTVLTTTVAAEGRRLHLGPVRIAALTCFAGYVAWCYASIAWAQSPGDALQGANQALLYLLIFAEMLILPWTAGAAVAALVVWVVSIGVIAIVLLFRLAAADKVAGLFIGGRLAAPTGYINSTAALFTIGAVAAVALSTRRELPGLLRGLMSALACADLQLALTVQSRGWLFTLPIVGLVSLCVLRDRLRVCAAVLIPVAGTLAILHRLLAVYQISGTADAHLGARAGQPGLLICGGAFVLGTILAWVDASRPPRPLSPRRRRLVGGMIGALAVIAVAAGSTVATHGHPFAFVAREWNGFSHAQKVYSTRSHFGDVGSGRYDYWRVSLDAFLAKPVGGIGEDNFGDYYLPRRRTNEEPSSTHSIELRLLAQTGLVGFLLFTAFLVLALVLASRSLRRGGPLVRAVAGIALLPLVVWLIHGSIDWFWEMPALSGPALGFLGVAGALGARRPVTPSAGPAEAPVGGNRFSLARVPRAISVSAGVAALVAAVIVLGLPYLSVREVSLGGEASRHDPQAALADYATAAELNPLSSVPGRLAGVVALGSGGAPVAEQRFLQSIHREPGGWFSWLGAGLAASALGRRDVADYDFKRAYAINDTQPADQEAVARVYSNHPLTSAEAFRLLVVQ